MSKARQANQDACEWDAKDAESVRIILAKVPGLPVDGVYAMGKVDAEAYR